MKTLLQKTLTALMITSLVAISSMAAAQTRFGKIETLERSATTMMPAPLLVFEDMKTKQSLLLQENLLEDAQKSTKSLSSNVLDLTVKGLTVAGEAALKLVTIDNTIRVAGIIGAAAFGPEVLVATESLQQFNKSLDNIEIIKNVKLKVEAFVQSTIKKGVTKVIKTAWGWFTKKK